MPVEDGGWGWMVVLGSFLCQLIADGCAFSFGILYVELLDYFGESKSKTAWIGSLFIAVPLITGPIAGMLTSRYGCRKITVIGGVIAGLGCVLSSQAQSVAMLCVSFGLVAGFGLSMVYMPAVIVITHYFDAKLGLATGIAVAGSGIGTFIFAPLTDHLIQEYGWRGTMLLIGGIMFHICICGMLFRPVTTQRGWKQSTIIHHEGSVISVNNSINGVTLLTLPQPQIHHGSALSLAKHQQIIQNSLMNGSVGLHHETSPISPNTHCSPTSIDPDSGHRDLELGQDDPDLRQSNTDLKQSNTDLKQSNAVLKQSNTDLKQSNTDLKQNLEQCDVKSDIILGLDSNMDELEDGSKYRTAQADSKKIMHLENNNTNVKLPEENEKERALLEDDYTTSIKESTQVWSKYTSMNSLRQFVQSIDFSVLRDPSFRFFCLSIFLLYISYDIPYIFTPDKAIGMGISEEKASFLVSIIGITSTFGQILVGVIGDIPRVNTMVLYNTFTIIAGLFTLCVPWFTNYALLCMFAACYGLFISANYTLVSVILVDLLGVDAFTHAYGFEVLAEGLANIIGPPFGGWLTDITGSYDVTFFVNGVIMIVSGAMLFAMPCFSRKKAEQPPVN